MTGRVTKIVHEFNAGGAVGSLKRSGTIAVPSASIKKVECLRKIYATR